MLSFLKPKEDSFFMWFMEMSILAEKSAVLLISVLNNPKNIVEKRLEIAAIDIEIGDLNNAIVDQLNQSFITPLDREDIFNMASKLERLVNLTKDTVDRLSIYRIKKPFTGAVELAEIYEQCTSCIDKIFAALPKLKKKKDEILLLCQEIFIFEQKSDDIYTQEIANLFADCPDPVEIIKWKEIYEDLEELVDYCDEIANFMRSMVMKYA